MYIHIYFKMISLKIFKLKIGFMYNMKDEVKTLGKMKN